MNNKCYKICDILDIINRFNNIGDEFYRKRTEQAIVVSVEKNRNNVYDLTFNKYREIVKEKVEHRSTSENLNDIDALDEQIIKIKKALRKDLGE